MKFTDLQGLQVLHRLPERKADLHGCVHGQARQLGQGRGAIHCCPCLDCLLALFVAASIATDDMCAREVCTCTVGMQACGTLLTLAGHNSWVLKVNEMSCDVRCVAQRGTW
jgi:hypothetical protein